MKEKTLFSSIASSNNNSKLSKNSILIEFATVNINTKTLTDDQTHYIGTTPYNNNNKM